MGLELTEVTLQKAVNDAVNQVRKNLLKFADASKGATSIKNFYEVSENSGWTTGFWPGEIWLAYELTKDEAFKEAGLKQVVSFLNRVEQKIDTNHHDMGFLYIPSCTAAYQLVGSEDGKKAAILAADELKKRFQEKGQFIQAWGELGVENNYRLIIDCLLNLPLLYWATEVTGDGSYADMARKHTKTALSVLIRPDGSTHHTYFFNPKTGDALRGETAQGYSSETAWARGQAWGVYGLALAYKYNQKPEYIKLFERVANFYIDHLPTNMVPYWDLSFTDGSEEPWDSSSSAAAICGMLEMAKYLPEEKAAYYTNIAKKMLQALIETCAVSDFSVSNGQLLHGTYVKSSPFNAFESRGVDECSGWGDYFYMEALVRLTKDWEMYW